MMMPTIRLAISGQKKSSVSDGTFTRTLSGQKATPMTSISLPARMSALGWMRLRLASRFKV
jgi:hypothetical protein